MTIDAIADRIRSIRVRVVVVVAVVVLVSDFFAPGHPKLHDAVLAATVILCFWLPGAVTLWRHTQRGYREG